MIVSAQPRNVESLFSSQTNRILLFILEYYCWYWYTSNILIRSAYNALSVRSDPVAAVFLCTKQDD